MPSPSPIAALMDEFSTEMFSIGPVTWHRNPDQFEEDTDYVSYDAQTMAGWAVFEYGAKPTEYVVSGMVGEAGQRVLRGGIADIERLRPPGPGQHRPTWPMRYPGVFPGVRYVKVTRFQRALASSQPYTHTYYLGLKEYPPALKASAVLIGDENFAQPLPLFGEN